MYITTKSGRKIKLPSDEEDARITAAAKSDPDARPWTVNELAKIKQIKRGRPKIETPKEHVIIQLDADILQTLGDSGKGCQASLFKVTEQSTEFLRTKPLIQAE